MALLFIFGATLVAVFFAHMTVACLAVLGLAWAPFGAVIHAMEGKKRGHNPIRYAITGAVCSLFFLIPWLYLNGWIKGKPPSRRTIACSYAALYLAWALGPILFWTILLLPYLLSLRDAPPPLLAGALNAESETILEFWLLLAWSWGMVLAFVFTLIVLLRARKQSDLVNGYLPRLPYLLPMLGLYASAVPYGLPTFLVWSNSWIDRLAS